MTNKIKLMKKVVCAAGIALLMAGSAKADIVLVEDFDNQTITSSQANGSDFGGASPEVAVGEWFAASNAVAINNGALQLDNFTNATTSGERSRGAGIWLDSSAWIVGGTVTIEYDVLNFLAGDTNAASSFVQAFTASGVDSTAGNFVNIDVHGGGGAGPTATANGTASIGTIGPEDAITGNVTDTSFTFNFTGGDFVALVFHNESTAVQNDFSIDNLSVHAPLTAVPEPTSMAILAAGMGLVVLRRRRLK